MDIEIELPATKKTNIYTVGDVMVEPESNRSVEKAYQDIRNILIKNKNK